MPKLDGLPARRAEVVLLGMVLQHVLATIAAMTAIPARAVGQGVVRGGRTVSESHIHRVVAIDAEGVCPCRGNVNLPRDQGLIVLVRATVGSGEGIVVAARDVDRGNGTRPALPAVRRIAAVECGVHLVHVPRHRRPGCPSPCRDGQIAERGAGHHVE